VTDETPLRDRSRGARQAPAAARHGRQKASAAWRTVLGLLAGVVVVALVSGSSVAAIAFWQLEQSIEENTVAISADSAAPPPNISEYEGGFNILIVGSDTREGQKGIGGDTDGVLNDVTMLLHVAQNQKSATLVSFPRDMVVPRPECENSGEASGLPINEALSAGGLDCVVRTVEDFTGLEIQFAGMITFRGVIKMTNAVGGVEVCIAGDIDDPDTGVRLKAGKHTLKGGTALQFLRTRHGVGDGSDIGRISSQQVYLSSLVRKMKSGDTLNDFSKLYNIATTATKNISLSKNFAQLDTLVSIALVLKNVPLDNIALVQYPGSTGGTGIYAGKVEPDLAAGDELMKAIKKDKAIKLDKNAVGAGSGSVLDPDAPEAEEAPAEQPAAEGESTTAPTATADPAPEEEVESTKVDGVKGQNASQYTCSQSYQF
jgi:LCP family protein required for cell wall assembly